MAMSHTSDDAVRGRVALVTGAGGAIGSATAVNLGGAGARVACVDLDPVSAERSASVVVSSGGEAIGVAADALELSTCLAAVDQVVERFGSLDILCNLVGYFGPRGDGTLDTIDLARWQW